MADQTNASEGTTENQAPAQEGEDLKKKNAALAKENKKLSDHVVALQRERDTLKEANAGLRDDVVKISKEIEALTAPVAGEPKALADQVFLGGVSYSIIHRNTVKELVEDYKKRHVPEDHTAVVIDKIGG